MDTNALIVRHMLDRQAEIAELRAALAAAQAEVQRLGAALVSRDAESPADGSHSATP